MHKTQELSLEGLNLSAIPSEVWESGEIMKVNLSKNSIEELPAQLSSSVSLQVTGFPEIFFLYSKKMLHFPLLKSINYCHRFHIIFVIADFNFVKEQN